MVEAHLELLFLFGEWMCCARASQIDLWLDAVL